MTVTGHHYTDTRVRGLADWSPKPATLEVLGAVRDIIEEYRSFLPMTARQIFYRLVGAHGYGKTELAYKRLLEYLNRGRRAGLVPWSAIRDDGFTVSHGGGYDSSEQFIDSLIDDAEAYTRDRQGGQAQLLEVWVEAAGMVPQAARSLAGLSVPVYSSGGFNSTTAKHSTARRIADTMRFDGLPTVVLHIGDYDPSGVAIIDSLAGDINGFLRDYDEAPATFIRTAVTPAQIAELELPGAPAKTTDNRAGFDDLAVQAEAIAPDVLADIIRAAALEHFDEVILEEVMTEEEDERAEVIAHISELRR
jgi:hypothetical protein